MFDTKYSLNLRGQLMDLSQPKVMGIINVTPDSFFDGGAYVDQKEISSRVQQMITDGVDIIDVGAYSSRPGAEEVTAEEEIKRLGLALEVIKGLGVEVPISVDTFRSEVADFALRKYQVAIINDISAGAMDEAMFEIVGRHKAAYVAMHMKGTPQTMMQETAYKEMIAEMLLYFSQKVEGLKACGVKDIIIDPGFGFAKDLDQNYQLLSELEVFAALELPLLVGVSRKSMIYKLLNATPEEALNGTTVLQTLALSKGANILRVHDVKAAKECVRLYSKTIES